MELGTTPKVNNFFPADLESRKKKWNFRFRFLDYLLDGASYHTESQCGTVLHLAGLFPDLASLSRCYCIFASSVFVAFFPSACRRAGAFSWEDAKKTKKSLIRTATARKLRLSNVPKQFSALSEQRRDVCLDLFSPNSAEKGLSESGSLRLIILHHIPTRPRDQKGRHEGDYPAALYLLLLLRHVSNSS